MSSISRLRGPLLSVASTAVLAVCGAAQAAPTSGAAWFWADQPESADPYAPNELYSFNSSGKGVTVALVSTGLYKVTLPGQRSLGASNVAVSAYGTSGYCMVQSWKASAATATALVHCYDKDGKTANTRFSFVYQTQSEGFGDRSAGMGFVLANQPRADTYEPAAALQYNSTGGVNTVTREQRGLYMVDMPGLTTLGGAPIVTAYGSKPARCKILGWGQDDGGAHTEVACFDARGVAADQRFSLVYSRKAPAVHAAGVRGVYAYGSKPTQQDYTPSKSEQYNGVTTQALKVHHAGTGQYSVTVPGISDIGPSSMLVSAVGADNVYCNVVGWYPLVTQCYGQGANPTESRFTTVFQEIQPK